MSGIPPPAPNGAPAPRPEEPVDPATADRRTLVVAAIVMFALVLVGVGSAAIFTGSACDAIGPDPLTTGVAGTAVGPVLDAAFPDADATTRQAMASALGTLTEELGPLTGIAEVSGGQRLATTEHGIAALGPTTTLLGPDGGEIRARAHLGEGAAVGSGATLYSIAIANDLTGQVDAVLPLDGDLDPMTCVDTALVSVPLAFQLAADGGQLLLLRADEDGSATELELRDPVQGRVWGTGIDIGIAPPGVQGERLRGAMNADLVVVGHRASPGDETPVVTALERSTGDQRWSLSRADIGGSVAGAEHVEVVAARDDVVVIGLTPESDTDDPAAPDPGSRVVLVDAADGTLIGDAGVAPGGRLLDAVARPDRLWTLTVSEPDGLRLLATSFDDPPAATSVAEASTSGTRGRMALVDDDRVVVAGDDTVLIHDEQGTRAVASDLVARDVLVHPGGVTLLFGSGGDGAVAVTFRGRQ